MTDASVDDTERSENVRKHTREVQSALSFMDLSEHVTWELGEAVDSVDYPLEVSVTIQVRSLEADTER